MNRLAGSGMNCTTPTSWPRNSTCLDKLENKFYYLTVSDEATPPASGGWGTMRMARTRRVDPSAMRILTHGSVQVPSIGIGLWCRALLRPTGVGGKASYISTY
jgi:hypothetical protein